MILTAKIPNNILAPSPPNISAEAGKNPLNLQHLSFMVKRSYLNITNRHL
jgi:hypothetical protein